MRREEMINVIDMEADNVRLLIVGDPVRAFEYQWAEQEAIAYRDAGFQGNVPASVSAWARAKNWADRQAAEDILNAASNWRSAMSALRIIRLDGKEDIRRAQTDADAQTAFALTLEKIKEVRQLAGV